MSFNFYTQNNSDIDNQKWDIAKNLYAQNNYSGALKLYKDLTSSIISHKLYYEIGCCYYKLNNFESALTNFFHSIKIEKKKNYSYLYIGNIYYKQENLQKAIENWCYAFSYTPNDESVCLNLATSYFRKNMRFQSFIYYEKYLKYAKDKTSGFYNEIKRNIEEFKKSSDELYKKAQKAYSENDADTAIQALSNSLKNYPNNFNANYLLAKIYFNMNNYTEAKIYAEQAFCMDSKSLDILNLLVAITTNLKEYSNTYCYLKRMLRLFINNQKRYLEVVRTINSLEQNVKSFSDNKHSVAARNYFDENNYHKALFEYENCLIIHPEKSLEYSPIIENIKNILFPEIGIIKLCLEKGSISHSAGDTKQANKYFSRVMTLSDEKSSEYKIAKSRIVNV